MSSQLGVFLASSCRTGWAIPAVMCTLFLVGSGAAQARGQWGQTQKLTADDAAAGDRFGRSVAIGGGTVVVDITRAGNGDAETAIVLCIGRDEGVQQAAVRTAEDVRPAGLNGTPVFVQGTHDHITAAIVVHVAGI